MRHFNCIIPGVKKITFLWEYKYLWYIISPLKKEKKGLLWKHINQVVKLLKIPPFKFFSMLHESWKSVETGSSHFFQSNRKEREGSKFNMQTPPLVLAFNLNHIESNFQSSQAPALSWFSFWIVFIYSWWKIHQAQHRYKKK